MLRPFTMPALALLALGADARFAGRRSDVPLGK